MSKHHFKSNVAFSEKKLRVDRKRGIVRGVCIVNHGKNKNGTYFNDDFLKDLTTHGNAQKQGVKCRFGHPNMCSTSLGSYIGRYKNFRLSNKKVFADLYLDPISKKTQVEGRGISMYDYIIEMAETSPDAFGNSIHINSELFDEKVGDVYFNSHKLESFIASDLVDDPAATDGLFSNTNDLGILVTEFLDNNPTIFEVIQKDPSIMTDFFDRYTNYLTQFKKNEKMSFLNKLKRKFSGSKFDIDETTAEGDVITILTDNEAPAVGDAVVDEDGVALEDGDVLLKDGTIFVIVNGVIDKIKEGEDEEEADEEDPDEVNLVEVMQSVNKLSKMFSRFEKNYKRDLKENQEAISLVADKFSTLARSVKSVRKDYEAERGSKKKFNQNGYDPDKAREIRKKSEK